MRSENIRVVEDLSCKGCGASLPHKSGRVECEYCGREAWVSYPETDLPGTAVGYRWSTVVGRWSPDAE